MRPLLSLALVLIVTPIIAAPPVLEIKGPTVARVGDIVLIDASASQVDHLNWLLDLTDVQIPSGKDTSGVDAMVDQLKAMGFNVQAPEESSGPTTHLLIDNGKKIITASYPGTWKFYLAGSTADGVTQKTWQVKIDGGSTPTPEPEPEPPVPPTTPKFGLTSQAQEWYSKVPARSQGQGALLKAEINTLANAAIAGKYKTAKEVESAIGAAILTLVTSGKLNAADWTSFGQNLNLAFTALQATGTIKTPSDYGYALLEVAAAL